jgi:hypothetical protein
MHINLDDERDSDVSLVAYGHTNVASTQCSFLTMSRAEKIYRRFGVLANLGCWNGITNMGLVDALKCLHTVEGLKISSECHMSNAQGSASISFPVE